MSRFKPQRTKPYADNETKEELKARIRRQSMRIAALETHINAKSLTIKKNIRGFEKSKEFEEKHKRFHLWAVVEELPLIAKGEIITGGDIEKLYYVEPNKGTEAKLYKTQEDIKDGEETTTVYRKKYYNVVNVFITKIAAEEHLEKYNGMYTDAKVVAMFPQENVELKTIRKQYYFLGESLPDDLSIWEEDERNKELKDTIESQKKEIKELDEKLKQAQENEEYWEGKYKQIYELILLKQEEKKKREKKN